MSAQSVDPQQHECHQGNSDPARVMRDGLQVVHVAEATT